MKTKILIIEHDSNDMELIQDELKKGKVNFIAEIVETKKEYTEALHTFKPDIIFSNYTFPAFDGLTALKIREKLVPQTPFIFVSESIGQENTEGLIKYGVTDFVLKKRLHTLIDKMNLALQEGELIKINTLLKESEEKRTEELAQKESKYQSLVESSMDAIVLAVKDGRILTANAAACEIFQMTEQEIINIGKFGLSDPTDPRLKLFIEERQRTGKARGELTLVRKNGSKFPAEVSSNVFKDSCGEEKTSMVIRDISDRKETEQKLAQSADDLQQALTDLTKIVDSSLDIICSYDEDGRIVSINTASERIWGYSPNELIGKKYIDFVFSEDAIKTLDTDTNIQGGVPVTMFENRYVHKEGHLVPMLWSGRWDEKDKINYAVGKDASEKKRLENAFAIERQRFMDLYSQAPSSMGILKGPNHVYEMANPLYLQLIDKKEDIIGKTVKEVLPEIESQGIFELLDTVYETGETFTANEMLMKIDFYGNGKLIDKYLNLIYQAHRGVDGSIDGILFFVNDVTEQVLSRKKIEESEKRYRELIENLPVATYSCDAEGRIMIYNKAAVALWGREPEIGKDMWCGSWNIYSVNGNTIPLELCPMAAALREGKAIISEEIIIEHPTGDKRNVIPYPVPFIDDEDRITGAVNVLIDITENKQTQQALMESEKKYRQIVETAQEGIWLVDVNEKTTFVNNKMCEILEYTRDEIIDKEMYAFMDNKGKQIIDGLLLRKEEKYCSQSRFKFISKNGKEVWVLISANPIFDDAGVYKGSLAMVTDITESKQAQQRLKENEKKYRYLFDNNPMPMWITELNTFKFLDVNKMAVLQYGYSTEEFLSMTAIDIRPQEEKESFLEFNDCFEYEPEIFNKGIWNHQKKDGTIIQVEIIAHKIIYEGVPARFILANDITDRRKTELNLEKRNKELIKTNSELDRFVYSVSHDLRSPLTSILGLLSFIETESLETDTLEHAEMIRNSINRLDDFIKNILSYSRNNRTGLEVEKISIQETALEILDSLQSMREADGIYYEIDIKEQQPFYTDRLRFNTILENLISNAIKHHRKEEPGRYIKILGYSDHKKLRITIADNGIGIAPEYHQKIFEMFFRLSGKKDGSGIGLYIVKDTIEILQGSIEIQSEKGIGTTFIITLKNLKP